MKMSANHMEISSRIFIWKGAAAAGVVTIFFLALQRGGTDVEFTAFYLLPYVAAILMPLRFTDFAAGVSFGAVLIELPVTLFFSMYGGMFPDRLSFLFMRIASALFFLIGVSSIFAYRQPGSQLGRFFGGFFVSIAYIILAALVLSAVSH